MRPEELQELLRAVASGETSPAQAIETLRDLPFRDLGEARIDHHRALRTGLPEVVLGTGKTPAQLETIARELIEHDGFALLTRIEPTVAEHLQRKIADLAYDAQGRVLSHGQLPQSGRRVAVLCAGTSDLPVASETAAVLCAFGHEVVRKSDVGVAGLHRLAAERAVLARCDAIVAVAGMEGALPGVVAGLVPAPVVGVPTSTGYGSALGGFSALLTMLASCSGGVAVVGIDNGFGAAVVVHKMLSGPTPH